MLHSHIATLSSVTGLEWFEPGSSGSTILEHGPPQLKWSVPTCMLGVPTFHVMCSGGP